MISALHGRGTGDLLDEIVRLLPEAEDDAVKVWRAAMFFDDGIEAVAIVGRPNVGKSTLFNRLIGDNLRSIVHDMPGTTRDAIDTVIETEDGPLRFVDTAGMRRKSRIDEGAEYFSLVRALQAIDRADAALLVIDATEGVTHQDQRLAERIDVAGSPVVIVMNKWELLNAEQRADVTDQVADRLAFLGYAPVLKVSVYTGLGTHKLMPALAEAISAYHRRIPTRELNKVVQAAQGLAEHVVDARALEHRSHRAAGCFEYCLATSGFDPAASKPAQSPAEGYHGDVLMRPGARELTEDAASHSFSFDQRRRPETFCTAMATAFFCPTSTTSRLPRVTPV